MRIKKKRNYPHPVISEHGDDFIASAMDCEIDFQTDAAYYYLNYSLIIQNSTIASLISCNNAHFVIHVECSKTFYRKAFKVPSDEHSSEILSGTIDIPSDDIKDATDVAVFICAGSPIENYLPVGVHPDYGGFSFQLENGDFMAVWKTCRFNLFQKYDPIKKADSIISFYRDDERPKGEIQVDTDREKLIARMPVDIHDLYEGLRADKSKEDVIVTMLALPVIVEGLNYIRELSRSDDSNNDRGLLWFRSIENKLDYLQIDIANEDCMFEVAQKILEYPYNRAAISLRRLDEDG